MTDREREELELLRAIYVNAQRLESLEKMHRRSAEPSALNGASAPNPLAKEITE